MSECDGLCKMTAGGESEGMTTLPVDAAADLFRVAEKRFRYRPPPPTTKRGRRRRQQQRGLDDFSDVIDLHSLERQAPHLPERVHHHPRLDGNESEHSAARIHTIEGCPGLFVITGALSEAAQLHWAHRCLSDFSNAPHTNISNLCGPPSCAPWQHALATGDCSSLRALRWASLGYHYDWTARSYTAANHSPFPVDLAALSAALAATAGCSLAPSAAIVNYYPLSSCMLAHVDDAELTYGPPIVSISLGQSAVFLIGGRSKATAPTAILLRSGDVVVMAGDSRRCFHGVPRIVRDRRWESGVDAGAADADDGPEMDRVRAFLNEHRININVRQVEDEEHSFATFNHHHTAAEGCSALS